MYYDKEINEDNIAESDIDEELPVPSVVKKTSKPRLSRTTTQVKSECYQFLLEYFDKNWFLDYWLGKYFFYFNFQPVWLMCMLWNMSQIFPYYLEKQETAQITLIIGQKVRS